MTKSKAIKLHCFGCAGESNKEVTLCAAVDCPLWEYRTGNHISSNAYKDRLATAAKNYAREYADLTDDPEIAKAFKLSTCKSRSVAKKSFGARKGAGK